METVISVLIPVRTGADALISCVDSFLSQKGQADLFTLEILLCTPSPERIEASPELKAAVLTCRGLAAYDPHVRVIETPDREKPFWASAFLNGLESAGGRYLIFSDGRACRSEIFCASLLNGAGKGENLLVFASDTSDPMEPEGRMETCLCPISGAMRFYNCLFETAYMKKRFLKNGGALGRDMLHHLPLHILLDYAEHADGLFSVPVPETAEMNSPCLPKNELSETDLCAQITEINRFIEHAGKNGDTTKILLEKSLTPYTPAVLHLLSGYAEEKKRAEAFMNRSQLQKWLLYAQFPKSCRMYEKNVRSGNYAAFRSAYLSDRRREKSALDAQKRHEKRELLLDCFKRREKTFLLMRKTSAPYFSVVPSEIGKRFHTPVLIERANMTYLIVCERDRYTDTDVLLCVSLAEKAPHFGEAVTLPLPDGFALSQMCLQTVDAWVYLYVLDEKSGEWYRSRMRRFPDLWEAFAPTQKPLLADHKETPPSVRTDKYIRLKNIEKYAHTRNWEAMSVYTRERV